MYIMYYVYVHKIQCVTTMCHSPQRQAHPYGLVYAELGPMSASKPPRKKPSQYVDVVPQDTPQIPSKAPEKGELFIMLVI